MLGHSKQNSFFLNQTVNIEKQVINRKSTFVVISKNSLKKIKSDYELFLIDICCNLKKDVNVTFASSSFLYLKSLCL